MQEWENQMGRTWEEEAMKEETAGFEGHLRGGMGSM